MHAMGNAIISLLSSDAAGLAVYLAALGSLGVATMVLIQTVKDLTPLGRLFQKYRVRHWLADGIHEALATHGSLIPGTSLNLAAAEVDLGRLAADGYLDALYALPVGQLCGQLGAAFQVTLDYPVRYRALLLIGASGANTQDLETVIGASRSQFLQGADNPAALQARADFADARNQISHQLQRAVDAFQISSGYRWKLWMQAAALGAGLLLTSLVVANAHPDFIPYMPILITALLVSFVAQLARDLTAAVQRLRGG